MNTEDDDKNATGKYNISHFEEKSKKQMHIKIKRLKKEIEENRKRERKCKFCINLVTEIIKSYSRREIKEFDQFNSYFIKKLEENSAKKFK